MKLAPWLKHQPGSEFFNAQIAAGQVARAQKNREEAEQCFRRALNEIQSDRWRYRSEWDRGVGAQTVDTFAALAEIHGQTGAFGLMARAIEHVRHARSQLGLQHPEVANRLAEVGCLYLSLHGKTASMDDYFYGADVTSNWLYISAALQREALKIRERVFGPFHPAVAESLEAIAGIPIRHSDFARKLGSGPLPLYERVLGIRERALGPDHPDVATSLERCASANGHWDESSKLVRRALRIREKTFGSKHPLVAKSLEQLSECLRNSPHRTVEERESLLRDALSIREELQGTDHPDFAATLFQLWCVYDQDRREDADTVLERAIAILLRAVGIDDPEWHGRRELIEFVFPPEVADYKVFRRVSVTEDASQLLTLNPPDAPNGNTATMVSRLPQTLEEVIAYRLGPSGYDSTILSNLANVVRGGYYWLLEDRGLHQDSDRLEKLTDQLRYGTVPQGWTDRLLQLRQVIAQGNTRPTKSTSD